MKIIETSLPGVKIIQPKKYGDSRGFFLETCRLDMLEDAGINEVFVQDNHSRSSKGVLRGLHYQLTQTQGKLVRVSSGSVFDMAVDVRLGSPNFGVWVGAELNEENMHMMYVPPGFAHGFLVLSDTADFLYKCTDYYHPQSEQGVLWNDLNIAIKWPTEDVLLSEKDKANLHLQDQLESLLPHYKDFT